MEFLDERGKLNIGIEPTATALAMGVTRLYCKNQLGKFKEANLEGIFCFIIDRRLKTRLLRLYDINTCELIFQTELYVNFADTYSAVNDKFYSFPLVKIVIGVEFANLYDAKYFKRLVDKFSFSGEARSVVKEEKRKYGLQNYKLSRPASFLRKQHNGWNPITQTFNIKEIPTEFKIILKKAGFKKKHLKKKETALEIYDYLLKNTDIEEDML